VANAAKLSWGWGLLAWLMASVLWGIATNSFYPVGDAASALWNNAPTAEEMVAQRETVNRSYNECLAQPPAGDANPAMQAMVCNMMKLRDMPAGLARDNAWPRVLQFSAIVGLGSLAIGLVLLGGARVMGRRTRS